MFVAGLNMRSIGRADRLHTMFSILILPSLFLIAVCMVLRWYCGLVPMYGCDDSRRSAGLSLRVRAVEHWRRTDPKGAASRAATLRFGMAAPPLSLLVVAFAVVAGRVSLHAALSLVLAVTALASIFGLLSAAAELAAVRRYREDPELGEEVRAIALAEVWNQSIPPALRSFFRGGKRMTKSQ